MKGEVELKRIKILVYAMIMSIVFLSGCVNKEEHIKSTVLNIPNVSEYTILYVQGVDDKGMASESTSKMINDNKKIREFISKVNKMEVIKPPNKELNEKSKELNVQGNYMFVLSDSEKMNNKVYVTNFFKDGSIQFQHTGKNELVYISKEKHPKLLKELKKSLGIKF